MMCAINLSAPWTAGLLYRSTDSRPIASPPTLKSPILQSLLALVSSEATTNVRSAIDCLQTFAPTGPLN